ncbi:MAG: hypothetical protein WA623_01555, partial [Candidatus Sulfotelmatobacter sp.]
RYSDSLLWDGALDPSSCAGERRSACGTSLHQMVARRGKSLGEQLKALYNQVGSYHPDRKNFRLTPEVKEKSTEKLRSDPHRSSRGVVCAKWCAPTDWS